MLLNIYNPVYFILQSNNKKCKLAGRISYHAIIALRLMSTGHFLLLIMSHIEARFISQK